MRRFCLSEIWQQSKCQSVKVFADEAGCSLIDTEEITGRETLKKMPRKIGFTSFLSTLCVFILANLNMGIRTSHKSLILGYAFHYKHKSGQTTCSSLLYNCIDVLV